MHPLVVYTRGNFCMSWASFRSLGCKAMREPDKVEFLKAMEKEVEDQMKNGNYSIINKNDVPKLSTILPAVWQMKQKRNIKMR